MASTYALIVAAGRGTRFGGVLPKQYLPLGGGTVLRHAVSAFAGSPRISGVIVVIRPEGHDTFRETLRYRRWPVELFVSTPTTYARFLQLDADPRHRKPHGLEEIMREIFPVSSYDGQHKLEVEVGPSPSVFSLRFALCNPRSIDRVFFHLIKALGGGWQDRPMSENGLGGNDGEDADHAGLAPQGTIRARGARHSPLRDFLCPVQSCRPIQDGVLAATRRGSV